MLLLSCKRLHSSVSALVDCRAILTSFWQHQTEAKQKCALPCEDIDKICSFIDETAYLLILDQPVAASVNGGKMSLGRIIYHAQVIVKTINDNLSTTCG